MPYTHLIMDEREIIAQMRYAGDSLSEIAEQLGRDKGTVSRELNRYRFKTQTATLPVRHSIGRMNVAEAVSGPNAWMIRCC